MQICDLGMSKRATNCLYRAGIKTVEELRQKSDWDLRKIRSFGEGCLREVQETLARLDAAKQKTNADRIRAMSDEELADKVVCPHTLNWDNCENDCHSCRLHWLQQPAEED